MWATSAPFRAPAGGTYCGQYMYMYIMYRYTYQVLVHGHAHVRVHRQGPARASFEFVRLIGSIRYYRIGALPVPVGAFCDIGFV